MARRDVQTGQYGSEPAREAPAGAPAVEHLELGNRAVAQFASPAPGLDPTRLAPGSPATPGVVGLAPGETGVAGGRKGGASPLQVLDGLSGQGGSDDVAAAFNRRGTLPGRDAEPPGNLP